MTVKADKLGTSGVLGILNRFIRDFKLLNSDNEDEGFDFVNDCILTKDTLSERVVEFFNQMNLKYNICDIMENMSIDKSKLQDIETSLILKNQETLNKRIPKIMYFGVDIRVDHKITNILDENAKLHNIDYGTIDLNKPEYHVTVAFNNAKDPQNHECFEKYLNDFKAEIKAIPLGRLNKCYLSSKTYEFKCVRLVTDDKGVALEVEPNQDMAIGNKHPHVTMGVAPKVMPVYSNELIAKSYADTEGVFLYDLKDKDITVKGRLFAFLK